MHPHINTLHSFLLDAFPDGIKSSEIGIFYRSFPEAGSAIRSRGLKTVCRDYPNLFSWTESHKGRAQGDGTVKAILNPNASPAARLEYLSVTAKEFFDQNLRRDITMRRKCEDRHVFDQIYSEWKLKQRAKGRSMVGCAPSQILFQLKRMNILEAKGGDGVLLWVDDADESSNEIPVPIEDRIQEAKNRVEHAREELEKNRNGVEVEQIDFGCNRDEIVPLGVSLEQNVAIINRSFKGTLQVHLNCHLAELKGIRVIGPRAAQLEKGERFQVKVEVQPNRGVTRSLILFHFTGVDQWFRTIKPFAIVRYIDLNVGDPADHEITKAKSPYRKKKINTGNFIKPIRAEIPTIQSGQFQNKLASYGIPEYWRDIMRNHLSQDIFMDLYYPEKCPEAFRDAVLDHSSSLTFQNYSQIFHRLLWTEEFQMEIDIREYDMINVALVKKNQRHFSLHVPGLAESRPSVLRGDRITVQIHGDKSKCFESYVDRVALEDVFLVFPLSFQDMFIHGTKVDVRFHFRRMQLRTMHQSLDVLAADQNKMFHQIMFPDPPKSDALCLPFITDPSTVDALRLYNRELNHEQKLAVLGAMQAVARPAPYLIYGPPGTGKTVTVVESIIQIMKARCDKTRKLLVCAPSNMAVDLIVERLAPYFTSRELLRLVAFSRDREYVPECVQHYAIFDEQENGFVAPPLTELMKFDIVATTVSYAGKLFNVGVENHFSHIVVDEAGHAIEPEIVSCFAKVADTRNLLSPPAVILAGDPKQLGPIVRNGLAKAFGLEQSMLERLSKRDVYTKQLIDDVMSYDSRMITKLVKNYRSHPSILKLPNQVFYDDDLIPSADLFRAYSLTKWEHLPSNNFPIIFHGIEGADTREGNSPSWFNPDEASLVKYYCNLLVNETRTNRCEPCEIGVVTPYHKQVQKVRALLNASHLDDVKVGSVEEFQGSERRVIIISTVRSSSEYLQSDNKHKLGFLSNPKRFNVAITRAQALLIVIGNPALLQNDQYWGTFIQYCMKNGGYVGCPFEPSSPKKDNHVNELIREIAEIDLNASTNDESEEDTDEDAVDEFVLVSEVTGQEGPAWNFEE